MAILSRRFQCSFGAGAVSAALCVMALSQPGWGATRVCNTTPVRVSLPGSTTSYTVHGTLCRPRTWAPGARQVDVLVHGGTYSGLYWNLLPGYSFVDATLDNGRAVYYFDQIGSGASGKPSSTSITVEAASSVLHQVIQKMRAPARCGGYAFPVVNVIGHSIGSYTAIHEAARYPRDVNRLVVTGALHVPVALAAAGQSLGAATYPVADDPVLSRDPRFSRLDSGYLTTRPGVRRGLFYYTPGADDAVIARDEATKDVLSATEAGSVFGEAAVQPPSANIASSIGPTVRVLIVVGQEDNFNCTTSSLDCTNTSAVAANERPYYGHVGSLTVVTVPNTGHDLALHRSQRISFAAINTWIKNH
jgi:pimeloyl-ACP methyl ester carboxylesterase